jgi:hypothetical protein
VQHVTCLRGNRRPALGATSDQRWQRQVTRLSGNGADFTASEGRGSDMLYYVGADFTVSGARSISTLRPSGDPARLSKPSWRGGGRGSGGPKTRQPGQLVSVCLELRCGTATHVALHAASGSASPNASDSPAKCVPNGGFGAVTTQSAEEQ